MTGPDFDVSGFDSFDGSGLDAPVVDSSVFDGPSFDEPGFDAPVVDAPGLDDPGYNLPSEQVHHDSPSDDSVVGDLDALRYWHEQDQPNSCAVVAQESILDEFTGTDHTEAELSAVAAEHGWYTPAGGTPPDDTGRLLALYGIETEQHRGATTADLEAALAEGNGVIVGVDSGEIWNPGLDPDEPLADYMGLPGHGADHAVRVVAVDHSDPANPMVVLSDSGSPDGQGSRLPLADFEAAWADSGNLLVTAERPGAHPDETGFGTSWTVPGETESGNAVEWSTSSNAYFDQKTWEQVEPT